MTLEDLRHDIDKIDTRILTLLNERMERALLTRRFKTAPEDKDREQALLERIRHASHNLVNPEFATTLYTEILSESKRLQENNPLTIGFQGEHGAFSEMAALAYNSAIVTIPCREFIDVFEGVESGIFTFGIVPVENTHRQRRPLVSMFKRCAMSPCFCLEAWLALLVVVWYLQRLFNTRSTPSMVQDT